ncbi:Acyl-CoA synthetase (AMP-forming)/AMP-acid ligase II [Sinosporangium album]|uniref:Acyl-CoA synthetase (AMP-forming)/AMP-acid ligase II n=1 Tax=Sinosporangium album TaxID=504805 RepID=A0A1G8FF07_9ACTN|nr:class I adenylate-forming enzyme family protein [Sinosporangium album]SDH80727.1 Acyl-CoA synthetase (AMP-forming)/AMP-acid ligase II [Sinosporangium album]
MNDLITGILETAACHPDAVAVVDGDGRTHTFGELRARIHSLRAAFMEGDDGAVLFAVRPGPDAVALALGAVAAGRTLVLADPGVAPSVFADRMALTKPAWVVAESFLYTLSGPLSGLARRRGLLLPRLADPAPGHPVRHLRAGPWLPGVPRGALSLARGLRRTGTGAISGALDDPALVVFTSGTTGHPRGVVHTRRSLGAGIELFLSAVPMRPGDVVHTDQLMLGLPALLAGATWSLPGRGGLAAELAARRATHAFGVPVRLDAALRESPVLPDTLRYLLLGAAPAPPAVLRRAIASAPHAEVLSVYAMTEALPIAVISARDKLASPGAVGTPLVKVRVGADGELMVSGPNVAWGYLGGKRLREVATGDLGRFDDEGGLVLLGRKKDMILRDGVNIYPGLYEPAVAALPGVAEAAIVGLADEETGDEEVVLALVPDADEDLDVERVRAALPSFVDAWALPDRIAVVAGLPRSGRTDKVDRAALRAEVAE